MLDQAEYSAFESTLNSSNVSYMPVYRFSIACEIILLFLAVVSHSSSGLFIFFYLSVF